MSIGAVAARIWHYGRWVLLGIVLFLVALAIVRIPAVTQKEKTADAVAFIKSRHITMADVDGQHLPPPPDPAEVDATVEGIDANQNGIRDDVELAIFKKYPNDARIRAAELQYAMTEQMYLTQVFNTETWKAVAEMNGRASICLSSASRAVLQKDATALREEVESLVFNTEARTEDLDAAFVYITSHGDQLGEPCDVAMSALDV